MYHKRQTARFVVTYVYGLDVYGLEEGHSVMLIVAFIPTHNVYGRYQCSSK